MSNGSESEGRTLRRYLLRFFQAHESQNDNGEKEKNIILWIHS